MRFTFYIFHFLFILIFVSCTKNSETVWLDDHKIKTFSEGVSSIEARKSVPADSVSIGGVRFERGILVSATSVISFLLNGNASEFSASVGIDDKTTFRKPVKFYVLGDGKILFESSEINYGDSPQKVSVKLDGIQRLGLLEIGEQIEHNSTRGSGPAQNWK